MKFEWFQRRMCLKMMTDAGVTGILIAFGSGELKEKKKMS